MTIRVLFFGTTADIVGLRSQEIETTNAAAKELLDRIIIGHPQLARHKLLFSINQEYVAADAQLNDGDEVAIFTAVSGG